MQYRFTLLFVLLLVALFSAAQDTLFIHQVYRVQKGKRLSIKPGTVVSFAAGARLEVAGSLLAKGTKEKPIRFTSADKNESGAGIVITGANSAERIEFNQVKFINLLQPLRFEPFWSRKEVEINNFEVANCKSGESVFYISNSLKNLNRKPIQLTIKNGLLTNNYAGILIENSGSQGISIHLDSLTFFDNKLEGLDDNLGMLHLSLGEPFHATNLKIGALAFHRNSGSEKNDGLTLSGVADTLHVKSIYAKPGYRAVTDYMNDNRLPIVSSNWEEIRKWSVLPANFIFDIRHEQQNILLLVQGNLTPKLLKDSLGQSISFGFSKQQDSIKISYDAKKRPKFLQVEDEQEILLPEPTSLPSLTKNYIEGFEMSLLTGADSLNKSPKEEYVNTVEVGAYGGLAGFLGDVRHKFGIPGSFEWSGGLFVQRNHSSSVSFRLSYYRNNVSMHNPTAAMFLWQSAPTYYSDNSGNINELNSWQTNFKTPIHSFEFLSVWYFGKQGNAINSSEKGRFIPAMGVGIGLIKYTPQRGIVYSTNKDSIVYTDARALGMEGQNFLEGKRRYGQFALNIITSAELSYRIKRFSIRAEFRLVVTTTDYLDDMGQGYLYGGNYDKWLATNAGWQGPINKYTGKPITLQEAFPRVPDASSRRTNNLLPDAYLQFHLGMSYNLGQGIFPLKNFLKTKKLR